MPFDGPTELTIRRTRFKLIQWLFPRLYRNGDRCRAAELSNLLRHRELWPADFEWNYKHPDTCAIGLARRHWNMRWVSLSVLSQKLGLPEPVAYDIFICLAGDLHVRTNKITPELVADAIDAYLATRDARSGNTGVLTGRQTG